MTTCNVCNGPMKVLLTSWYCPNDCDRKPYLDYQLVERCDGRKWRVAAICAGETIPEWATRLRWISYGDFSPDHITIAVHVFDLAYGVNWGSPRNMLVNLDADRYKDTHWLLAMAPES